MDRIDELLATLTGPETIELIGGPYDGRLYTTDRPVRILMVPDRVRVQLVVLDPSGPPPKPEMPRREYECVGRNDSGRLRYRYVGAIS